MTQWVLWNERYHRVRCTVVSKVGMIDHITTACGETVNPGPRGEVIIENELAGEECERCRGAIPGHNSPFKRAGRVTSGE
jgi:hypothetical protein